MILADKIMNLRKKNGWSQEELAEKLGVSRQSISKYEGAQSVPDLDKIIKLSQIFGVTTDYLVKDELSEEEYVSEGSDEDGERTYHKVTMEMAQEFLSLKKDSALKVAIATVLCIWSPIALLLLCAASELTSFNISENAAAAIGLCGLILLIAVAVCIFILSGNKTKKYEFLESEEFETEYGVSGMVKDKKEKFRDKYTTLNVFGTLFCICSVIPIFLGLAIDEDGFIMVLMVCVLLFLVSVGTFLFIYGGTQMSSMNRLLEEEDYSRARKREAKKTAPFATAYWLIATAIYLAYSFITEDWDRTWIVWPVAGVVYPAFVLIVSGILSKKENK